MKSPVALNTETEWRVEAKKKSKRKALCVSTGWSGMMCKSAQSFFGTISCASCCQPTDPCWRLLHMRGPEKLLDSPCGKEKKKREKKKNSLEEKKQDRKCSDAKSDSGERRSEIFICTSWLGIRLKENILWRIMFVRQGSIFPQWVLNFFGFKRQSSCFILPGDNW